MIRNKRINKNFDRRIYRASHPNQNWQIDLFDITNGTFLFNCVDVYSRKVSSVKIKDKTTTSLINALKQTEINMGGKPQFIQSDLESGIYSHQFQEYLKSNGISTYTVENGYHGRSAPIVERFNKTVKDYILDMKISGRKLNLHQLATKAMNYANTDYNDKIHRTTGFKPNEAHSGEVKKKDVIIEQQERENEPKRSVNYKKYKVGDTVLVAMPPKGIIQKKFTLRWNKEPYTIHEIFHTNPITYTVQSKEGVVSQTKYYGVQLQKIEKNI